MTFMDDFHGWLDFAVYKLFLQIVYRQTDRQTDLHWYLLSRYRDWKVIGVVKPVGFYAFDTGVQVQYDTKQAERLKSRK